MLCLANDEYGKKMISEKNTELYKEKLHFSKIMLRLLILMYSL